ncbi:MAG: hypothetical protein ACRELF_09605 [Gemmataceae bacterium]
MSDNVTFATEIDILEQVIDPNSSGMAPEVAKALLELRFRDDAVAHINALAEKNRQGTISTAERALLERYQRVGNFLNLIHAKARCSLAELISEAG